MNKRKRTVYDREFKLMVINLCLSGKPASSVAEDMDLDKSMVRRWIREHKKYQDNSFQGNGNVCYDRFRRRDFPAKART